MEKKIHPTTGEVGGEGIATKRIIAWSLSAAATVALAGSFLWMVGPASAREVSSACAGLQSQPSLSENRPLGKAMPELSNIELTRFNGEKFRISDFLGKKVVVLNFWAASCKICKQEKPTLSDLQSDLGNDVEIISVSGNDWQTIAKIFPNGAPYDVIADQPLDGGEGVGPFASKWGVTKWPETFIIDKKGVVRYYMWSYRNWSGGITQTCLRSLIRE